MENLKKLLPHSSMGSKLNNSDNEQKKFSSPSIVSSVSDQASTDNEVLFIRNDQETKKELENLKLQFDFKDTIEEFIGKELQEFYLECHEMEKMIKDEKKAKVEKAVTAFLFQRWKDNSK